MKKTLFLLLAFVSLNAFGQLRDSLWWTTPYFKIAYSEVLEEPRWIQYRVACPTGNASRAGMDFYKEISTKKMESKHQTTKTTKQMNGIKVIWPPRPTLIALVKCYWKHSLI